MYNNENKNLEECIYLMSNNEISSERVQQQIYYA